MKWLKLEDDGFKGNFWTTDLGMLAPKNTKIGRIQTVVARYGIKDTNQDAFTDLFTIAHKIKRVPDGFHFCCPRCSKWVAQVFLCKETRKKFVCEACFMKVWEPGDPDSDDPRAKDHFVEVRIDDASKLPSGFTDLSDYNVTPYIRE